MNYSVDFIHPNPYTFDSPPRRQYFCLPLDVISHMTKNPCSSAKGFLKLQKTCKYFFAKNKIIVVNHRVYLREDKFIFYDSKKRQEIFLKKSLSNYWLNYELNVQSFSTKNFLNLIYRCNLEELVIYKNNYTFNEFNFLVNGGKIAGVFMNDVNIRDDNGNIVSCGRILEKIPNIKHFQYSCKNEIFNNETFKNMNSLKFKSKIKDFDLSFFDFSPDVNFNLLCKFIQNNANMDWLPISCCFSFEFKMNNSQVYQKVMKAAVKKMKRNIKGNIDVKIN